MKIEVLALQAKKDDPENEGNKIAFTFDGHLCGITDHVVAHQIIASAYRELEMRYMLRGGRVSEPDDRRTFIFNRVGRIIANREDLTEIAKRA